MKPMQGIYASCYRFVCSWLYYGSQPASRHRFLSFSTDFYLFCPQIGHTILGLFSLGYEFYIYFVVLSFIQFSLYSFAQSCSLLNDIVPRLCPRLTADHSIYIRI
jgi:hypothetical protein